VANLDIIRGRQVIVPLTNKSGGAVAAGDVVVIGDGTNDKAFTTTTTASFNARMVGIAQEAIAADAEGRVLVFGYAPLVNSAASLTRDHFLFTSSTAKEATGSATRAAGAFGQVLETGTDPEAVIWGMPDGASGGSLTVEEADGTPSVSSVTTIKVGNGDLTDEGSGVVRVKTAADASGGGTFPPAWSPDSLTHDYEFDSALSGWTDLGTPTKDADSTADSHLYLERASSASVAWDGIYRAIPATPFTVTIKVTDVSHHVTDGTMQVALILGAATPGEFVSAAYIGDTRGYSVSERYTNRTTYNTQHGAVRVIYGPPCYLRFTVNSTTSYDSYCSHNGLVWVPIVTAQNPGFTIGSYGIAVFSNGSPGSPTKAFIDWLDLS